jgi:tetratricopeptide (TPR) repeat protein
MEQLEKTIRYLDGEVVGEEKQLFEKEISTDESLKETLRMIHEVNRTMADEELLSFVNQLKETQKTINKENSTLLKKRAMLTWRILAAACFVALLVTSFFLYSNYSRPSNDKIFANYYHRYEAELLTRSAGPSEVSDLIKAIQLYDKGNYQEAIVKLEAIIKSDASNTAARFFIGVSYIETKNFDKAIENLNFVIAQNDTAFVEHAEWYLSLCYVKTNQMSKAKTLLHKIANGTTFYKMMASDALSKMK